MSKKFQLPPGHILAPMAGITDHPYRVIARKWGAGLLYTEVISAEGIRRKSEKSLALTEFSDFERPIAVQLFGSEAQQFSDAAIVLAKTCKPDVIDINCGCPVRKFVTRGCGGYLMNNPAFIGEIVQSVRECVDIPVTVKLRTGYRRPFETAVESAISAEESGAVAVAIHGRYVRGAKGSSADWSVISRVKKAVNIPVLGNGDIFSYNDASKMMSATNCDRVMIGRWARGNPWIFKGLLNLDGQAEIKEPEPWEKIDILIEHYKLMLGFYKTRTAVHRMRKQIGWYTKGLFDASKIRGDINQEEDPKVVLDRLLCYKQDLYSYFSRLDEE